MRLLLDECVPKRLKRELRSHEVKTIQDMEMPLVCGLKHQETLYDRVLSSFGAVCAVSVTTLITGCGDGLDDGELGRVVGPTPTLADLAGSWGGRIDPGGSNSRIDHCHGLVWTATQDGTIATGRFGIQGVCPTCPPSIRRWAR